MLIPIHAYPVLDRENLRDIFPKVIDFGEVDIGDTVHRVLIKHYNFYYYIKKAITNQK